MSGREKWSYMPGEYGGDCDGYPEDFDFGADDGDDAIFHRAWTDMLSSGCVAVRFPGEACSDELDRRAAFEYLEFERATDAQRFARKPVMDFARNIGFAAHLRDTRPLRCKRPFVAVLLDHLGVPWRDDYAGGVLPALLAA